MADQPLTHALLMSELERYYREVMRPDMHRVVEDLFERRIKPPFDEIDRRFDAIDHKLDKLATHE